jgi:protein SCO1/2
MSKRLGACSLVILLAVAAPGCTREPGIHGRDTAAITHEADVRRGAAGVASLSDATVFDLEVELVDHDGQPVRLDALRGRPTVAAMIYTSCTAVCPRVTEEMIAIEQQLAGRDDDVRLALFSLDAARDTPAALRAFAAERRLDLDRWTLMATSEDGVRNLAAVLGVKYRPEPDGEFAHSALIVLIDRDGVIRHRQVGIGQDVRELLAAVRRLRQ